MRLKPFFCFYGGKHRIAGLYPAPEHSTIIEPFAGSAGYATLHHQRDILLIERDERIAALWAFLIRASRSDILGIPLLGPDDTIEDIHGPEEARSLVGFWLNKGVSSPRRRPSAWMRSGIRPGSFWGDRVRDRVAHQVSFIKHWRVVHGSYETAPDVDATWFIDPPYMGAGSHYRYSLRESEFPDVARWVHGLRGLAIVCENAGAAWLPFENFVYAKANESKHGGKRSAEAVYIHRSELVAA